MDSELRDQTWVGGTAEAWRPLGGPSSLPSHEAAPKCAPGFPVCRLCSRLSKRPSVTSRRDRQGAAAARVASAPPPPPAQAI